VTESAINFINIKQDGRHVSNSKVSLHQVINKSTCLEKKPYQHKLNALKNIPCKLVKYFLYLYILKLHDEKQQIYKEHRLSLTSSFIICQYSYSSMMFQFKLPMFRISDLPFSLHAECSTKLSSVQEPL
jgi:hypothetical protein